MPEQEFDLYLSLLVKLLRLSPDQKTSIERELRDHFEERFEALVRSGIPRDEAIRRTLDEFGDVAGLANEFTHLSRKHIRRRIMQGTAATAGIAAAIVIYVTLFRGPDPAVGPAPNLVAQENADDAPAVERLPVEPVDEAGNRVVPHEPFLIGSIVTDPDVEWIDPARFMPEWSAKTISVDFADTPLREVIRFVSTTLGINTVIDSKTLADAGITGDEGVSLSARYMPTYAVLNQVLHNINGVELTWVTEDEVVKITTKKAAEYLLTTRYHNVRDLLDAGYTHEQLANLIAHLSAGPWEKTDGVGGVVSDFGDLLIVRNSEQSLAEAECVLAGLRSDARVRWIGEPEMHARLYIALDEETECNFSDMPLRDVVVYLAERHKIPIGLDTAALADVGVTGDESAALVVEGIKLRSVLRLLLEGLTETELDFVARDGALWVTTKEVSDQTLEVVIYNVEDITGDDPEQMERLLNVVMVQTSGPWEKIDGIGGLPLTLQPGEFACYQTARVHDEVAQVLEVVRNSLQASGGDRKYLTAGPIRLESRFYRMDAEAAGDVARLIPNLVEPGTWQIAGAALTAEGQIGTIHELAAGRMLLRIDSGELLESGDKQAQAAGTAPQSTPSPAVDPANSNVVVIPQSVLIITHKPAVLNEVSKLLKSLLSGDADWTTEGAGDKVKFIAPGYQEGKWNGTLGGPGGPAASPGGGFFSIESLNR